MSLFRTVEFPCPSCAVVVPFELNHSVNADRRPALRDEILARRFQQQPCPSCGIAFRIEPEFTYIETRAGLWIAVMPSSQRTAVTANEGRVRAAFDKSFGASAPAEAAAIGATLRPRLVFGWEALHEKLVAAAAGIDDVVLELAKIALVRSLDDVPSPVQFELRLLAERTENGARELVFGWFRHGNETLAESLAVPATLLDEIAAAPAAWAELRAELAGSLHVDMLRLMLPTH